MGEYSALAVSGLCLAAVLTGACWTANGAEEGVVYSVDSWPRERGNHRALIEAPEADGAVRAHIPWRRRDPNPKMKKVLVFSSATGEAVANVVCVSVSREAGELAFEPVAGAGAYEAYYMPYEHTGPHHQFATAYASPGDGIQPDPAWLEEHGLRADYLQDGAWRRLPEARTTAIQARSEFDRMDPMEVPATAKETRDLLALTPGQTYLVFPESRAFPIRMTDRIPVRWLLNGARPQLEGEAARGEFYAFQAGVYAATQTLEDIRVDFSGMRGLGGAIPEEAFRCISLGGTGCLGRTFEKTVNIEKGKIAALWCGVHVPKETPPGRYEGMLTVQPRNAPGTCFKLVLEVTPHVLDDSGDGDLWRQARLRWLDSTIGLDDDVVAPYTPMTVEGRAVGCLGRELRFNGAGLPESVRSGGRELLDGPIAFYVEAGGNTVAWSNGQAEILKQTPGAVEWESSSVGGKFELRTHARMEFDGYVNFRATLKATEAAEIHDAGIAIPLRQDTAEYMMGMGRKGGRRPGEWQWTWNIDHANNAVWIGGVEAGLQCKLKDVDDAWNLYNFHDTGLPQPWENGGKGGCTIAESDPGQVLLRAYSGGRTLAAGEEIAFRFGLLITPVKPLDPRHWNWRYQHEYISLPDIGSSGANIINIHHGNALNPNINYPFNAVDELEAYIDEAHAKDVQVKIYYTVRELSNHVAELWALRSLGDEVFRDGGGGGCSWLHEHLVDHYAAAWHEPRLPNGQIDGAIATTGLSRWHNYYLEGLRWLIENAGIDGLYLDGIGYDRVIMQRVRKVMERARPGSLIDFHSGNNFHPQYGLGNCANQYMEHFPYIDSLWFGEGFDYDESPDYWLVEISGIPFGLFGEMLQGGGNPWRGMVYGMTNRLGWGGDPRPIWKLWDAFGIQDADMLGYWNEACPIKTSHTDILATVYRKEDRALVALASWAEDLAACELEIDWDTLGLDADNAKMHAPPIEGFQEARTFALTEAIPVEKGRGWLILIE